MSDDKERDWRGDPLLNPHGFIEYRNSHKDGFKDESLSEAMKRPKEQYKSDCSEEFDRGEHVVQYILAFIAVIGLASIIGSKAGSNIFLGILGGLLLYSILSCVHRFVAHYVRKMLSTFINGIPEGTSLIGLLVVLIVVVISIFVKIIVCCVKIFAGHFIRKRY